MKSYDIMELIEFSENPDGSLSVVPKREPHFPADPFSSAPMFNHALWCNADHSVPVGNHSCSCLRHLPQAGVGHD